MKIRMNLKNNFKLVEEGERELTIMKAEVRPSGKPNSLIVTFQDKEGGSIINRYNFDNDKSLFAMGKLLEVALGFEDGDEFDTKTDPARLINKTILCEVVHTQGTKPNDNGELPTFANIKKTISLVENNENVDNDTAEDNSDADNKNEEVALIDDDASEDNSIDESNDESADDTDADDANSNEN